MATNGSSVRVRDTESSLEKVKRQLSSGSGRYLLQGPLLKRSETVDYVVVTDMVSCGGCIIRLRGWKCECYGNGMNDGSYWIRHLGRWNTKATDVLVQTPEK
ncbi:PH domain containing protein [Zea mays]|uniref:PH domain containing protein n=1 Tax=Zea mays TaxID=4577 RepID=A0A1D6GKP2_MAIZE|nr:PH domain containing protein [Zea mays]AQK63910.1 PH domain containing protein [Zea mays]